MKTRLAIFLSIALATVAAMLVSSGIAQTTPPPAKARATLVADTATIVPGQPFTVAIVFKIEPKWHLYYKNPGDSGLPPSVKWKLPDGLTAGELQFPKPDVLKTPAGKNFVYTDELSLLVTFTPGKDFTLGRSVEIAGALKWLECDEDMCVPRKQDATLTLTADEHVTPTNVEEFKTWREKIEAGETFDPAAAK